MLERNCPKCNKIIKCKSKQWNDKAIKEGKSCRSCINKNRKLTIDHKNKISNGLNNSQKFKDGMKRATDAGVFSGENNGFYGKKHRIETINMLSDKCGRKGEDSSWYGRKHSINSRQKMSNTRSKKIANGEIQVYAKNGGYYKSLKTNTTEHYDSYLELLRMQQMDIDDNISHWTKKHKIRIGYKYNNVSYNYVPDFLVTYVSGDTSIDEVKGYDQRAKDKLNALKKYSKDNNIEFNWYWMNDKIFNNYKVWMKTKNI